MKSKDLPLIAIILLSISLFSPHASAQQYDATDQHIPVNEYSGGGKFYFNIGSFNASSGDFVGIYLSTSSTNSNYSEIEVQITGKSGIVCDERATSFAQTIQLLYDDNYSITIIKRTSFFMDLMVRGEIVVYHHPVPLVTNPPSPTPAPSATPSHTLSPTSSPAPTSSSTTSILTLIPTLAPNQSSSNYQSNLTALTAIVSGIAIVVIVVSISLVYFKKHKPNTELDKKS